MKLRVASIAFLLASASTGIAWFSLQPSLVRLLAATASSEMSARVRATLPLLLALDLSFAAIIAFIVLYVAVGRPLRGMENQIEQLGRLELELPVASGGGPLLSRLQGALRRMAEALKREEGVTRRQLAELRQTNERLTRTQAELVSSERLATVGRLAAGVAHEIGNPLSGILGYLSVARVHAVDSAVDEYLSRIDSEVQRIDRIVRELLDLGRAPSGALSAVDISQVTSACAGLLGAGPDFARVTLDLKVERVFARAESGALSQVVLNLLINAAQAVGGEGRVQLRGLREGERVRLEVEDSGKGIAPEVMPRLFEPFFTTKGPGKGTGLGLAISRHLVSQMGGELQVANAPSGGAVFTIVLPAA